MSNPYKPGRPFNHDRTPAPKIAGTYWWNNPDGSRAYQGISNSLARRIGEHCDSGKIPLGTTMHYMVADEDADYEALREHERRKCKQHQPTDNKRGGGGGRTPKGDK